MEMAKTIKELKVISLFTTSQYLNLSQQHHIKLTNHRKIPCSKYSGRYLILFEDTSTPLGNHVFCMLEVMPTEEEIEPP